MRGFIYKRVHARKKDGKPSVLYYAIVEMTKPGASKRSQDWGRGHHTRREAESDLVRRLKEAHEERVTDSKMPLGTYLVEHWLPQHGDRIEATTVAAYIRAMAHIIPRIGGIALRDLKPMHFNKLYVELRESGRRVRYGAEAGQRRPLAPATVRRVHTLLSKALNDAIDEGMLNANPARRAKPPRESRNCDLNVWSAEELTFFLASVRHDRLYPLAAGGGHRHATW